MKRGTLHFDELPPRLACIGLPKDIPVVKGKHALDVDIDESALPADVVKRMRACCAGPDLEPEAFRRPVGISMVAAEKAGGVVVWDSE